MRREAKITHFCLQTRELIQVERKRKKKKRKKEEQRKGTEEGDSDLPHSAGPAHD